MSHHKDQTVSVLERAVQTVLSRGLNDPRVRGLISVTGIKVSDDLRNATVMVSILPEEHAGTSMHGLKSAARHIRREVGDIVSLRRVPDLSFKLDQSLKKHAAVLAAIEAARQRDADNGEEEEPST